MKGNPNSFKENVSLESEHDVFCLANWIRSSTAFNKTGSALMTDCVAAWLERLE